MIDYAIPALFYCRELDKLSVLGIFCEVIDGIGFNFRGLLLDDYI